MKLGIQLFNHMINCEFEMVCGCGCGSVNTQQQDYSIDVLMNILIICEYIPISIEPIIINSNALALDKINNETESIILLVVHLSAVGNLGLKAWVG